MKILVDTNVIIDAFVNREPFYSESKRVIEICDVEDVEGYLAAHSITNIQYVLSRRYQSIDWRVILHSLFEIFEIEGIDFQKLQAALETETVNDYEDCVQVECAASVNADYIVTRDRGLFSHSRIPCILPQDFCDMFSEDREDEKEKLE